MPRFNAPKDFKPSFGNFPAGDFNFTVENAEDQISKNNNEMIKLTLSVDTGSGNPRKVYYYAVFSENEQCTAHMFSLCSALGLDFYRGELSADDCLGRRGKAKFRPKKDNPSYGEVHYFIYDKSSPESASAAPAGKPVIRKEYSADDPDEIPF